MLRRSSNSFIVENANFSQIWANAFPGCLPISRDILLNLDKEVLMEIMIGVSALCNSVGFCGLEPMDSSAKSITSFHDHLIQMNLSQRSIELMQQYMDIPKPKSSQEEN
jgi:hypothetical protein